MKYHLADYNIEPMPRGGLLQYVEHLILGGIRFFEEEEIEVGDFDFAIGFQFREAIGECVEVVAEVRGKCEDLCDRFVKIVDVLAFAAVYGGGFGGHVLVLLRG